jgi:hypothetical protein
MAGGRIEQQQELAWDHTSHILAQLYNVNRGPKNKAKSPGEYNPYAMRREREAAAALPPAPISILKQTFVDQRPAQRD